MKNLIHNQEIRVTGFPITASRITVGTALGYGGQECHDRAVANGDDTAFTTAEAGCICSDYPGKAEEYAAKAAATAAAVEISDGELVIIEGQTFKVRVAGHRFSDPVHFIPTA